ncbi:dynamin family protein [Diaporthe sp. PMI_573]|nr:dynamin family protein [Diaporthaceae sp. PMI_573]
MDSIDGLRSEGIDHFVSLPQITVCGDQSSGKSSVLEAMSSVSFPVRSNLCTRFPTELVLRRTSQVGAQELEDFEGFSALIDTAKSVMGISARGKTFAIDLLRIKISRPGRPHLTIVDLPVLIHSQIKQQTASDVQLIQEVVESYIKEPRSIILAVVSEKNDFANQVILKLVHLVDVDTNRTFRTITKPNALYLSSESKALYISLARNQQVDFRLDWHILKNMDSEADLPHNILGIQQLYKRLSKVLLSYVTSQLPSLVYKIESKRNACHDKLVKLSRPRLTTYNQQLLLLGISESFQRLVKSVINSDWNDVFFKDSNSDHSYQRQLRAVIQNSNDNFAKTLSRDGHRHRIGESSTTPLQSATAISITRDEFLEDIGASPWERLVRDHVDSTVKACKGFLQLVISPITDPGTSTALLQEIIGPAIDNILMGLNAKTDDILKTYQRTHPITCNHYFTETIRKLRAERRRDECASAVRRFYGPPTLGRYDLTSTNVNLSSLVDRIIGGTTEPDMNRFAASEVLDYMEAYYKVAIKRFIDDIAIEVIEVGLVSTVVDILSPVEVYKMNAELVANIAGKSKENQIYREQVNKQAKEPKSARNSYSLRS